MSPDSGTERLFAGWIARCQNGDGEPLEALLAAHPDRADALGEMAERFRDLEEVLALIGMQDTVHAPVRELDRELRRQAESVLARLRELHSGARSYSRGTELGSGGMARVLRVWDEGLERELAMKVLRPDPGEVPTSLLWRFLNEARLTGSLEHPGIVPVHDLGIDDSGRVYFTMRKVGGLRLDEVFERTRTGADQWSVVRVLEVLIKVCDTLAFAHARGVVHRDLKPANVMVGEYGETYVLDWGLARVLEREEEARCDDGSRAPSSATDTAFGDVVGTPAYMPPEQAAGELDQLAPTADVYALGAMLYELLAGHVPYSEPGVLLSSRAALQRVGAGPPAPLNEAAPDAPPELVAIGAKAMARDPTERYPDASALAADLRAFVVGRVVGAYSSGRWAELWSWVRRNRSTAGALGAAVVVVGALIVTLVAVRAARRAELDRLASLAVIDRLEARAALLWPAWPENERALAALLGEARVIMARKAEFEAERDRLAALGRPLEEHGIEIPGDTAGQERLATRALPETALEFDDPLDRAEFTLMNDALRRLNGYSGGDRHTSLIRDLEYRLEWARSVRSRSIETPAALWTRAREEILASDLYAALDLAPQTGLVPLGPDPASGLQEFAHLASGEPARRGPDGRLQVQDGTGMVLVLIPGGWFAPPAEPDAPEAPDEPAPIRLDPFFLAKHELTHVQWQHLTGELPSMRPPGTVARDGTEITPRCPVESVSWGAAHDLLRRLGLGLPTQAQWQHAARANTSTVRWTGDEWASLSGHENLGDRSAALHSAQLQEMDASQEIEDGWLLTCPVDALSPNPWGLQHMLGNVSEWCADISLRSHWSPYEEGSGARRAPLLDGPRVVCGGHWNEATPMRVRSVARASAPPERTLGTRGVRAARAIR